MLVRPMVGAWEIPRIEGIACREARHFAVLPVPGLSGELQQDLGKGALLVEIHGSLHGDEARDTFLKELRSQFLAGEPVDFVADIVNESELERVTIAALELEERAGGTCAYRIVLREYTEPPEPPGPGADFGLDVDADLGLDVDLGLDLLDLPGLFADVPQVGDLLSPVKDAAAGLKATLSQAGTLLGPLDELLG